MLYLFAGSMPSLVSLFLIGRFELTRHTRFGGNARRVLERRVEQMLSAIREYTQRAIVFAERDLFIKLLHAISYVALVTVRYMERKLVRLTQFFRTLRRREHTRTKHVHNETQKSSDTETS